MNNRQRLIDKEKKKQYKRDYKPFYFKIPRKKKKEFRKNYLKFMERSPYVKPKKYTDTDSFDLVQKKVAGGFIIAPRSSGKKETIKRFLNGVYGKRYLYGRKK